MLQLKVYELEWRIRKLTKKEKSYDKYESADTWAQRKVARQASYIKKIEASPRYRFHPRFWIHEEPEDDLLDFLMGDESYESQDHR